MNEERMRILKMIQEGQISAEEGARLIEALEGGRNEEVKPTADSGQGSTGRLLKIRVVDSVTGREKINLNVPIGLAKMLSSFIPETQREQLESHGVRLDEVLQAVESGQIGKIVDMTDNDRGDRVEISIE